MPSSLERARLPVPPAVHPLELRSGGVADRGDHPGQALAQLVERARLHRPDRGASDRPAGDVVADAGDVALVRHRADEPGSRPLGDLRGEAAARAPECGSASASGPMRATRPRAGHQLGSMSIATRIGAEPRPAADSIRSRCAGSSTISAGWVSGRSAASSGQLGERPAVRGRIADEDVLVAPARQMERLGKGEAQDPAEALVEAEDRARAR